MGGRSGREGSRGGCRPGSPPAPGTPPTAPRSWLELQTCLFGVFHGFSTPVEGIGLRRNFFFFFGRSLVVLGISPSPSLHHTLVRGLGDRGTGRRLRAEMAGLVAADRRGGTRGGRSFAQVRSLRRGAGQAGRVGCAPCPAPGHRWETSLERSLPGDSAPPTPRALTPAAWAPPRRPRAPRSRSPRPRLPPPPAASGSGPGRRSGSEHFPRRPLPTGCDSPLPWHPRFARAPVARLTMKPRACAVVGRGRSLVWGGWGAGAGSPRNPERGVRGGGGGVG